MKKIFNFKRKKGSPSPSETASVLSASYDVKEKDLGKVHKAAFKGDVSKLRQLAKKSDLNQLDKENRTPLHIACSCGHTDVVHFLVESKVKLNLCDNQNRSALMKAVQCEMERSVSMLLEHEADPNLVDINGNTALHLAARIPSSFIVLQLLEHSACINAQNKDGNTALMLAVMENHTDMSELLLKEGADVNIQNVEQRSALMMAACQGQISMVRLLLRYHADITVKDDKGWSSEDYAVMNGHHACSHLIIEHGTKRESLQSPSHVGKKKETSMIRSAAGEAGLPFKAPALDKDEDNSHTDSISRASRSGAADSWSSSDEELDFSIKRKTENVKKPIKLTLENKEAVADEDEDKSWNTSEKDSEEKCETRTGLSRTLLPLEPLTQSPPSPASLPPPNQRTSISFSSSLKKEEASEKNSPKELQKRSSSENKRETEDNSHTDSISRASRSGAVDSCPSSDEELDFSIKRKTENVKKPIKLTLENKEGANDELTEQPSCSKLHVHCLEGKEDEEYDGEVDGVENLADEDYCDSGEDGEEKDGKEAVNGSSANATELPGGFSTNVSEAPAEVQENVVMETSSLSEDRKKAPLLPIEETKPIEIISKLRVLVPVQDVLDSEDGYLVSAIRVEAKLSDEEENEASEHQHIAFIQNLRRTSKRHSTEGSNESACDDDWDDFDDDDNDDGDDNDKKNQNSEVKVVKETTMFEGHAEPDALEGVSDLKLSRMRKLPECQRVPAASPSSDDDWDDVDVEEGTKKPLVLFWTLLKQKESDSPEESWGSDSRKPDGGKETRQHQLVQDSGSSKRLSLVLAEQVSHKPLQEEPGVVEDSDTIPVSVIVGCDEEDDDRQTKQRKKVISDKDQMSNHVDEYDVFLDDGLQEEHVGQPDSSFRVSQEESFWKTIECADPNPKSTSSTDSVSSSISSARNSPARQNCNPSPSSPPSPSAKAAANADVSKPLAFGLTTDKEHGSEFLDQYPDEEVPYTVIDAVNLSSDSDAEEKQEHNGLSGERSSQEGNPVGSRDEMTEKIPEEPHEKPSVPERDFLSELGLEKDDDHDSPWDSESESGSHRIIHSSAVNTPTKATRAASSVCDEDVLYVPSFVRGGRKLNIMRSVGQPGGHRPSGIKKKEDGEKHKESSEAATVTPKMKEERVPSVLMDSREVKKNSSQAEDLRLAVADDHEDMDSVGSISRPRSPLRDDYVSETTKAPTQTSVPLPSPRFIPSDSKPHPLPRLRSDSIPRPESSESDWDTDASSPARRTEKPDVTKPEPDPQDDMADDAVDQSRKTLDGSLERPKSCQPGPDDGEQEEKPDEEPWEERYEKIWVEKEKMVTKSQFKSVAAELKSRFGELNPSPSRLLEEDERQDEGEDGDFSEDYEDEEDSSEDEDQLIQLSSARLKSSEPLLDEPGESGLDESQHVEPLENPPLTVSVEASENHQGVSNDQDAPQITPEASSDEALEMENQADTFHISKAGSAPRPDKESSADALLKTRSEGGKQREESMRGDQRSSALWDGEGLREASQLKDESIPSNTKLGDERNLQTRSLRSSAANCPVKAAADKSQRNVGRASSPEEQDHRAFCRRNQELDDGTLSDLSEDGRSPSSRCKKEEGSRDVEVQDDLGDLTQSSDTATEELETSGSGFRNASMLFKQLDTRYLDSVSVVKLQNMFHEYERTIQRGRDRHSRLADKNSQLERERSEQKTLLEEIRSTISDLEHRNLELETDLNTLKFLLRQEQEKHQTAQILYNKTREQLQRKEEQQRCEAEERHKAEQKVRNLELDVRALKNSIKQLEEDRDESQRLLSHERSARSLQEELLSNHLRKQQDIEEENLRQLNKSNEVTFQLSEASEREREFLQQKRVLQEKLLAAQAELDRSQSQSQQEESRLAEEREVLRERLEDARRDLKLNEEALTQTVFQYNALKAEFSVVTAKLEHERQMRPQLEAEVEANRARLQVALQEAERCQASRAEAERLLQRGREEHQRIQEKLQVESSLQRDTVQSLSQKLSKAEARANSLENECHRGALTAAETGVLLESLAREKDQAQVKLKELESSLQSEREQVARAAAKQEAMLERLALAQSEGALLRQQLEEALSKDSAKDKAVTHVQHNFAEMLNQLRADGEKRVHLVEERSSELARSNSDLRDQNCKLEQEKTDREVSLRKLQQELADCLKKLSMCEASLEVNTRYRHDLEEDKSRALKDLDRLKAKLQESEDVQVQAERRISQMKSLLDEQQRESCSTAQKLQEALAGAAAQALTVKQLEEAVQRLEIENARLEATTKQQSSRVEALQKSVQDAAAVRNRLEDLVTNLQSSKMSLEEQLNREMQKQSTLSHNVQDSQSLWEEELKNRSRLGLRLSELEKEKGELTNQMVLEKKKANKLVDQKKSVDSRLEQEINRNTELQKEMYRLRTLLKTAKRQLRESGGGQLSSPASSFRGLETDGTISRMKIRVDELQTQYEREASRCSRLEEANRQLKDKLTSGRSREQMDGRRKQLEEEVKVLRRQLESGVMDHTQAELFRRETEERARQEIRHKLEEVNIFLQTQAASQDALEQMKAANEASQRSQLEQRIRDLEAELSRLRGAQQDSAALRDSSRTELERYKQLYGDELRLRKSLASKLERSSERLAEANTKLLSERQRSKSLLSSTVVSGVLGPPPLDVGSLGSTGTFGASLGPLNRSLSFANSRLGTAGESPSTCVEAYIAKMQTELGKNILKELDHMPGELDGGSARLSPVGSASNSPNLQIGPALDLSDPVLRATQQYLEVLKKNHKI